jgi:hypothetical protein
MLVANIFTGNAEVQHETSLWLQQQPIQFYTDGFQTSVKWWDKCIIVTVAFVKNKLFVLFIF